MLQCTTTLTVASSGHRRSPFLLATLTVKEREEKGEEMGVCVGLDLNEEERICLGCHERLDEGRALSLSLAEKGNGEEKRNK